MWQVKFFIAAHGVHHIRIAYDEFEVAIDLSEVTAPGVREVKPHKNALHCVR